MRARIEHDWHRDQVNVWVYSGGQGAGPIRVVRPNENMIGFTMEEVTEGAYAGEPEPTYVIPKPIFEAIVENAGSVLPPSAATDRHLQDSVKVRDRLLALVEQLTTT